MATAIIADTNNVTTQTLTKWLHRAGVDVSNIYPLNTWYDIARVQKPDLCFLNAEEAFKDKSFIQKAKLISQDTILLIICPEKDLSRVFSQYGDYVFDIVTYPINLARIALTVRNALQSIVWRQSAAEQNEDEKWNEWLPGSSESMNKLREKATILARSTAHVLITGDTGTGKRNLAEQMHASSARVNNKVASINCAQWPTAILQVLLFGTDGRHQNPSPGPAIDDVKGGTLILDNIDQLMPTLQQRLYYALANTHTDVRVVSTATPALYVALDEERFSAELYNLLSAAIFHVPSLSERIEDIPLLVQRFAESTARQWHTPIKMFTPSALNALQQMPWPYNIRELKNTIERLILLGHNPVTDTDVRELIAFHKDEKENGLNNLFEHYPNLSEFKSFLEKEFIQYILEKHSWNISQAADNLGMQRSQLYNKMDQYGLKRQP